MADIEEHYILRVQDKALAERLRKMLREEPDAKPEDADIELFFESDPRQGSFKVGADEFPVRLLDLPTIVETYKTYDDTHLVKCTDVGQMLVVSGKGAAVVGGTEARHGLTPPMRDARRRHFRPRLQVAPAVVSQVEEDLLAILRGGAPEGVEYIDIEEEYVVDLVTGTGAWVPTGPRGAPVPQPQRAPKMRKKPGPKTKKQLREESVAVAAGGALQGVGALPLGSGAQSSQHVTFDAEQI